MYEQKAALSSQPSKHRHLSEWSFIFLAGKEFFLFLDDSSLEPADDVDGREDDYNDQQNDLYSFEVPYQLLNTGGERKAEARKNTDPNAAACKREQRESQKAEVNKSVENRARSPKSVDIFDYEHRQHAEPVHELFNSRPGASEEVPAPGSSAKPGAHQVAEGITDKAARGAYD